MDLITALRIGDCPRLALVGAGGKSTAMFSLARQLLSRRDKDHRSVFLTATTHLSTEQLSLADRHYTLHQPDDLADLEAELPAGLLLFTGPQGEDGHRREDIGAAGDEAVDGGVHRCLLDHLRRHRPDLAAEVLPLKHGQGCRQIGAGAQHHPELSAP